jgi:hypothetical protein
VSTGNVDSLLGHGAAHQWREGFITIECLVVLEGIYHSLDDVTEVLVRCLDEGGRS